MRDSLRALLEAHGLVVRVHATAEAFLADEFSHSGDCLIVDVHMPGMSGLELQEELNRRKLGLPMIVVTGYAEISLAVRAIKAGAVDFVEKPFDEEALLAIIRRAIAESRGTRNIASESRDATAMVALLTERERQVLGRLTLGEANKLVAYNLGISPRTVEIHRANIQRKLKANNLAGLVRTAHLAGQLA
jgi:two-component system response regulator FixJ